MSYKNANVKLINPIDSKPLVVDEFNHLSSHVVTECDGIFVFLPVSPLHQLLGMRSFL